MGHLSYGYKASKTPIGKKVVETVKNIFTKKNKVSPDIKSVAPNVPVTKADKVKLFFDMFSQLPSWFTNLWILVVASIYGIKGTQIFRNGGGKK